MTDETMSEEYSGGAVRARLWTVGRIILVVTWAAAAVTLTILIPTATDDPTSLAGTVHCADVVVASCANISGPYLEYPLVGSVEIGVIARAAVLAGWGIAALASLWFVLRLRVGPGRRIRAAVQGGARLQSALRIGRRLGTWSAVLVFLVCLDWLWWASSRPRLPWLESALYTWDLHTLDQLAVVFGLASSVHVAGVALLRRSGPTPKPVADAGP